MLRDFTRKYSGNYPISHDLITQTETVQIKQQEGDYITRKNEKWVCFCDLVLYSMYTAT